MISPYVYVGMKGIHFNPNKNKKELLIKTFVAESFGINIEDLNKRCNKPNVVVPRQLAMYFISQNTQYSNGYIAELFGGFERTTVTHSLKQVNNIIDTKDPKIYPIYLEIKQKIKTLIVTTNEHN